MAGQGYRVPDLASVLQTLASFAPPPDPQGLRASPHAQPQTPDSRKENEASKGSGREWQGAAGPSHIDPATIIDWSPGLRCVMKTVAANESIIKEIQRMIKVQHEHEEQWWAGRQDLLQRQGGRKERQRQLDDVLRAVGGKVEAKEDSAEEADSAQEVTVFDAKVYRAQIQMVKEMSAKLKGFGVPFFGTRGELVRKPGQEDVNHVVMKSEGREVPRKIDEGELVALQRRMIGVLEDLCSE